MRSEAVSPVRNRLRLLGFTEETDIYFQIYGNIIPTYHFDNKTLVSPEDMFIETQRVAYTRELLNINTPSVLIRFYVSCDRDEENRILNVSTLKKDFEAKPYYSFIGPIPGYEAYVNQPQVTPQLSDRNIEN